jgi:uncharacterized membrane protein (DUF373 family)
MTAVHFVHNFREALFAYIGSVLLWFLVFVAFCYAGDLFHRFIQFANVKLGVFGLYLTLGLIAAFMALLDGGRLLHAVVSIFVPAGAR